MAELESTMSVTAVQVVDHTAVLAVRTAAAVHTVPEQAAFHRHHHLAYPAWLRLLVESLPSIGRREQQELQLPDPQTTFLLRSVTRRVPGKQCGTQKRSNKHV